MKDLFHFAHLGLGLFIFISGYLLYANNPSIRLNNVQIFYKKRLLRIYPLYLLALICFFISFEIVYEYLGFTFISGFQTSLTSYAIHAFGAQVLLAPEYAYPMLTLWYIGLILLYYMLYPLLVIRSRGLNDLIIRSVVIFMVFAGLQVSLNIIEERFFLYYFVFMTGIVASHKKVFSHAGLNRYILPMLLLYLSTFMVYDPLYELNIFTRISILYVMIMTFIFLVFYAGRSVLDVCSIRLQKTFVFISTASYCVYLFHRPALSLFYGVSLMLNPGISDLAVLVVGIPSIFVIGYYIQVAESRLHSKGLYSGIKLKRSSTPAKDTFRR